MPRRNSHQRLKSQRTRLYHEQRGLCFWCSTKMVLPEELPLHELQKRPPPHLATTDHMDDKFSPVRGTFRGERRRVCACRICNLRRSSESVRQNWDEHLRRIAAGHQKKLPKSLSDASPAPSNVITRAETI